MSETEESALLLTGRPGVGKTTVIRKVVRRLEGPVAGFYTEEIRGDGGSRKGFRIVDFDGWTRVLAHVDLDGEPRVSKYGVDVEAVDEAVHRLPESAPLYVVDEIGKMECFSEIFVRRIEGVLDGDAALVATVARRGGGFPARVRERPDARVVEVSRRNRDELPDRIVEWVAELPGDARA